MADETDGRTHYEGCWKTRGHYDCAERYIARLEAEREKYEWRLITPENLPQFDDLLLQDMLPPQGAWVVSNKHYKEQHTYDEWIKSHYRWFAKMRLPRDYVAEVAVRAGAGSPPNLIEKPKPQGEEQG